MSNPQWKRAACLMTMLAIGLAAGPAQPQDVRKDVISSDKPPMVKVIPNGLLARILELASHAKDCKATNAGPIECEIEMATFKDPDTGTVYCVARAPRVAVPHDKSGSNANKRLIVWHLNKTQLDGKALAFHEDAGIIITAETHKQVDLKGKRLDANGNKASDHFRTSTKRNVLDLQGKQSSTYLPVILWGPSGEEELCAAVDPKIVNVQ